MAFSVAIGGTEGAALPVPHGRERPRPGRPLPHRATRARLGMVAELVHATTGLPVAGGASTVTVDKDRRQIEVRVPHGAWNPGTSTVRLAAGVGLWDKGAGTYLAPAPGRGRDPSWRRGHSGRASGVLQRRLPRATSRYPDGAQRRRRRRRTRRGGATPQQGAALASGDITTLHADVDFGKLAAGVSDDSGVPKTGPIDRILASHFETAQGVDHTVNCLPAAPAAAASTARASTRATCSPTRSTSRRRPSRRRATGMTLLLHSLGAPTTTSSPSSVNQSQFGERGARLDHR